MLDEMCFFFQAEDGIRDAQESRGLGDVYKRQHMERDAFADRLGAGTGRDLARELLVRDGVEPLVPVSYTHLTLPTLYSV